MVDTAANNIILIIITTGRSQFRRPLEVQKKGGSGLMLITWQR